MHLLVYIFHYNSDAHFPIRVILTSTSRGISWEDITSLQFFSTIPKECQMICMRKLRIFKEIWLVRLEFIIENQCLEFIKLFSIFSRPQYFISFNRKIKRVISLLTYSPLSNFWLKFSSIIETKPNLDLRHQLSKRIEALFSRY